MKGSESKLFKFTGIRMMIAIQVFSFLLAIITGFFALEVGSVELNKPMKSEVFYTFKDSISRLFLSSSETTPPTAPVEMMPVKQVRSALNKMRLTVLICGFVAFFSGIVLNVAIKNTLKKLTRSLSSVAQGNFTENLDLYSQREIGQVIKAYNRMVSSINRHILETSAGATLTVNRGGIITGFNPMAEIMFHRDYRDIVGSHFTEFFPVTKKNRDLIQMIVNAIERGEPSTVVDLTIATRDEERKASKIVTSILSSDSGKLVEVMIKFGDFEQVKEIQTQMERMNRLASLGSLVAGLAHEIRTPLGSLKGFAQLLGEELVENDRRREYTEVIVKEIDRLNAVVEELLSFAQPTTADFEARDVNEIVRDALLLVKTSFPKKPVEIVERYAPDLPKVVVERNRLVQAILNILHNAFEATADQGRIIVETKRGKNGRKGEPGGNTTRMTRSVVIDFTNSGAPIAFEEANRMFDPFFTTKEKGTGLGLAIAQQVATAHGGSLRVFNQPGTGQEGWITFRMELPTRGPNPAISESPGPF